MALNWKRRRTIEALADAVLNVTNSRPPVPVDRIVTELGGRMTELPATAGYEASVRKAGETFEIATKPAAAARRRFSIAHELGHLFLHMGYVIDPKRWVSIHEYIDEPYYRYGYSAEEREANEFAASLLMPRESFILAFREVGRRADPIEAVAKRFHVSREAATYRAGFLGLLEA